MTDYTQITLTIGTDDQAYGPIDHSYVELTAAHDFTKAPTFAEALHATRHIADLLGRVAATLAPELITERDKHHCDPDWGCHLSIDQITTPTTDLGASPLISFTIPTAKADHWQKRVTKTIRDITADSTWTPTHVQEAQWTYGDNPQHATAPARARQEQPQ